MCEVYGLLLNANANKLPTWMFVGFSVQLKSASGFQVASAFKFPLGRDRQKYENYRKN